MAGSDQPYVSLHGRIAAIGEYAERATALTAMIESHCYGDAGVDAATHSFLLVDQLTTSLINHSWQVSLDADEIFLDLAGVDRDTYDALARRAYANEPGARTELAILDEAGRGIPDIEGAIDALCDANRAFRCSFDGEAFAAFERIETNATLFSDVSDERDRVIVLPVAALSADERLMVIASGTVSWVTYQAVVAVSANVSSYMCANRGAIDLGPDAPVPDPVPFSNRVSAVLDAGAGMDDAYAAAWVRAVSAPCNQ